MTVGPLPHYYIDSGQITPDLPYQLHAVVCWLPTFFPDTPYSLMDHPYGAVFITLPLNAGLLPHLRCHLLITLPFGPCIPGTTHREITSW